jgi:polysaccharide export outer membrane protein
MAVSAGRIERIVGAACALLALGVLDPLLGQGARAGVALESVGFEVSEAGGGVRLSTSGPLGAYICTVPAEGSRDLIIEIPDATTKLPARVDLKNSIVPEVSIENGLGARIGVRVRLAIGHGALQGIEQNGQGLVLRFGRSGSTGGGEYRIGVGDKIEIGVFGHEDLAKVVEVRSDGTINYPLIGDIRVVGMTAAEIDAEITRVLGKDYLVDPQVSVDVREYQSQWVTIIGEVRTPGKYVLKRNMRVIDVLAEAGGATKEAGTQIVITRQAPEGPPRQIALDRATLLSQDNQEANLLLQHGDIVAVGERELFYIRGEVARPGPYQFESGMTILKAISYAGGFTQFANRKQADILRSAGKGVQGKITVNVKAIEEGKKEDLPLRPGDTVIVPRRIF